MGSVHGQAAGPTGAEQRRYHPIRKESHQSGTGREHFQCGNRRIPVLDRRGRRTGYHSRKTVDVPGTYDFEYIIPLDLSGEFENQPSADQLRERAEKYVEDNNIGVPTVSITVAFQPLEQTEEYKDIALLEKVNLCDTVTVEYPTLGVSATAKCVKTVYDVLKGKYTSIDLGDAKTNLADTIVQQQKEIEKAPTITLIQQADQQRHEPHHGKQRWVCGAA